MATTTTLPTVESYAKKDPDVPEEVILKEDLLRLGLNVTRDAMELSKGCREQAYYFFSYNISSHDELADGVSTKAPEDIRFHGGPYGLRPTSVRVVLSTKSPYAIDVVEGKPTICENGTPVAEASFPEKPSY